MFGRRRNDTTNQASGNVRVTVLGGSPTINVTVKNTVKYVDRRKTIFNVRFKRGAPPMQVEAASYKEIERNKEALKAEARRRGLPVGKDALYEQVPNGEESDNPIDISGGQS